MNSPEAGAGGQANSGETVVDMISRLWRRLVEDWKKGNVRSRCLAVLKAIGMLVAVGMLIDFLPIDLAIVMIGFLGLTARIFTVHVWYRIKPWACSWTGAHGHGVTTPDEPDATLPFESSVEEDRHDGRGRGSDRAAASI